MLTETRKFSIDIRNTKFEIFFRETTLLTIRTLGFLHFGRCWKNLPKFLASVTQQRYQEGDLAPYQSPVPKKSRGGIKKREQIS